MSSATLNSAPNGSAGGRAGKPGPRWRFGAAAVIALAAAVLLTVVMAGGASGNAGSSQKYGGLPKWLPKMKSTKPTFEVATPNKPILGEEQGYTVHTELAGGADGAAGASADVTALGPQFPSYVTNYAQAGKWPANKLVPSTFFVTLARVHGTIPIRARDFSILTYTGQLEHVRLAPQGAGKVPAVVHPGQTVTFKVISQTLEGQGAIRWAPSGNKVLAAWIYQVELD